MNRNCYNLVVDERPVAYWSLDVKADNVEFLEGLDASYFSRQIDWLTTQLDGEDRSQAAVAIRLLYGHCLETFFALVGATVQAPHCPLGWVLSYQNAELRSVVHKISQGSLRYTRAPEPVNWGSFTQEIFRFTIPGRPELDSWVKEGFATVWARFAWEFVEDSFTDEHNSLKHGFRVKPGGFSLKIAPASEDPLGAPNEPVIDSRSEFGTTYFRRRQLTDRHNITADKSRRNWNPRGAAVAIELLAVSIHNVVTFLRVLNGIKRPGMAFRWPEGPSNAFEAPFEAEYVIASASERVLRPEDIVPRKPDDILGTYQ